MLERGFWKFQVLDGTGAHCPKLAPSEQKSGLKIKLFFSVSLSLTLWALTFFYTSNPENVHSMKFNAGKGWEKSPIHFSAESAI